MCKINFFISQVVNILKMKFANYNKVSYKMILKIIKNYKDKRFKFNKIKKLNLNLSNFDFFLYILQKLIIIIKILLNNILKILLKE